MKEKVYDPKRYHVQVTGQLIDARELADSFLEKPSPINSSIDIIMGTHDVVSGDRGQIDLPIDRSDIDVQIVERSLNIARPRIHSLSIQELGWVNYRLEEFDRSQKTDSLERAKDMWDISSVLQEIEEKHFLRAGTGLFISFIFSPMELDDGTIPIGYPSPNRSSSPRDVWKWSDRGLDSHFREHEINLDADTRYDSFPEILSV